MFTSNLRVDDDEPRPQESALNNLFSNPATRKSDDKQINGLYWNEYNYAMEFGRSPNLEESFLKPGVGGTKRVSSVSAIETGWYVCGRSADSSESLGPEVVSIGMGLSLPGILRVRAFCPRRLQSRMIPTTTRIISTRAFNAITPRIAGRNLERFSTVVATSVDSVTVVDPPDSEFETL